MQLLEELNKKKINSQADMFQFSDHMVSLYEMWLQKEGSKVHEPGTTSGCSHPSRPKTRGRSLVFAARWRT